MFKGLLEEEVGRGEDKKKKGVTETLWGLQSLKYMLYGSLQKKFANLCPFLHIRTLSSTYP